MLSNYERVSISSTTNPWPQTGDALLMAPSARIMEKPTKEQSPKCPRCDSSNTKFCYYNNYSLSQPRHFCKACKRYWTKGGTLRNVPVGGGCRKNKRIKKPSSDHSSSVPLTTTSTNQIDGSTTLNHVNSMFYGVPNPGYDFQSHQFNSLGLGFSSEAMTSGAIGEDYRSGFNSTTQIHDVITSNSLLSNFSLFGSSSSTSSTPTTTASMFPSSFQHRNLIMELEDLKETKSTNHFQALLGDPMTTIMKEVKLEEKRNPSMNNKLDLSVPYQNPIEAINSLDSSLYWNSMNVGAWPDLSNYGSSITHLI